MNFKERLLRLAKALNLSTDQMAELFGVSYDAMHQWMIGRRVPQFEFRATLLRLESDKMAKLSPHLRADTLKAFCEGRDRAVLEEK